MASYVSFIFLWITLQFTQQAMEFQKEVFGWGLDDTILFHANQKQVGVQFCLDDGLIFPEDGKAKEHDVNDLEIPYVSEILEGGDEWMDSKFDLSILDSEFHDHLISTTGNQKPDSLDVGSEIESLVDHYFQENALLPFETSLHNSPTTSVNDTSSIQEFSCISEPNTSYANVLEEVGLQLPSSPLETSWSVTSSPAKVPSISDDNLSDESSSEQEFIPVQYYIEVAIDSSNSSANQSLEKALPTLKIKQKISNAESFSPYHLKRESRRERKKVQNKEAAQRYRMKKKEQDKVLGDEVEGLENEQKSLQEKHDSLKTEIKYLKSLMREMFKARGLLK